MTLADMNKHAKDVSRTLNTPSSREKNMGLEEVAKALLDNEGEIPAANKENCDKAEADRMNQGLLDRLRLIPARVQAMAGSLLQVTSLNDPAGEVLSTKLCFNGLQIGQEWVPLDVIGMTYEARPNATVDAFGLCFESGNAVILGGGSDVPLLNQAIVETLWTGFSRVGLPEDSLQSIEDTSREIIKELMRLNRYIDVPIPRGSVGLIRAVVENSTIPVVETRTENCHAYVGETVSPQMALDIILNVKTQRIGVCSVCESPLVRRKTAERFLFILGERLDEGKVEIRGDEGACAMALGFVPATEKDWGGKHLDYILLLKIVGSVDEAISHISTCSTGHSESIVTSDHFNAQKFLDEVDVTVAYANASTCPMDGSEFGFGAEIGASTQKLHARGPIGSKELIATKYIIYGDGQIRWFR